MINEWITLPGSLQSTLSRSRELVILPGRPLLAVCDSLPLPTGAYQVVFLHTAHRRVKRAAGKTSHLHDRESVNQSAINCLQIRAVMCVSFASLCIATILPYVDFYLTE